MVKPILVLIISLLCVIILGQQCIPLTEPSPETPGQTALVLEPQPQVTLETGMGTIVIELFSYQAPQSVENFLRYIEEGYYDNTLIHEISQGKWITGGWFDADVVMKELKPLVNESNNGLINIRRRVCLFGFSYQDTGSPLFLINLSDSPENDFNLEVGEEVPLTVIGKVIQGMNVADNIGNQPTTALTADDGTALNNFPSEKILITRLFVSTPIEDGRENQPPTANAGKDRNVVAGLVAGLDGSASSDPDFNDNLTYLWEQIDGPSVTMQGPNQSRATFTVPDTTTPMSFQLTVDDGQGHTDTATVTLTPVDDPRVRLQTSMGDVILELLHEQTEAPITALNFMQYVEDGFYNGTIFHRVLVDFVVQGGGFLTGLVQQKPLREPIVNEFDPSRSNLRGTVAMAKLDNDPDSATSQFFFNLADNSANLDIQNGGFTVFAQVIVGMDVIDAIAAVQVGQQQDPNDQTFDNVPVNDITVLSATIEGS
ncbi:MAG: peptidylprolyl isomerase [Planctomycetota bacterium]|nr:MAG: peptidylprolyl isomerase [Planctomycetota bacterium]